MTDLAAENALLRGIALWYATGIGWRLDGNVGASSSAMAQRLGLRMTHGEKDHPRDPCDLDRCLRFLALFPELRDRLSTMSSVSPEWARLIARWGEVEASHLEEVGLAWTKAQSAPLTYALMQEVLKGETA